jgi:ParB-like chromosome segregation protein Spo0J
MSRTNSAEKWASRRAGDGRDCQASAAAGILDPAVIEENSPESIIPLSSLAFGYYLREQGTDATHVRLLADAAEFARLPPILVQAATSRVIDGMHRVEVAKRRGESAIRARIVDCTDEEALVLAIKSNTLHGLPLSRAERISSAKRILAMHTDWSDRAVAGITGLSAKSISSLRNGSANLQTDGKRLGRDGRRRPAAPGEGRLRAAEYISAHPEASLRQVARETDVSIGTVHDVREKMRRGAHCTAQGRGLPDSAKALPVDDAAEPAGGSPAHLLHPHAQTDSPRQLTWSAVSAKITSDPALRYTAGGRAFLRWMAIHSMQADEWREFADAIPSRWHGVVHRIAADMSREWSQFANQVRTKGDEAAS